MKDRHEEQWTGQMTLGSLVEDNVDADKITDIGSYP